MIRIEVAGVEEVNHRLQEVPKKLEREVLREMSQIVYDEALQRIDKHTKTGALRQSLYNRAIPGGREIGNDPGRAPHAKFVHWPTKPHLIKPKEGGRYTSYKNEDGKTIRKDIKKGGRERKMLRWTAGGQFIFAKFVRHPGYKGDPYLVHAAREAIRRMPEIVARISKGL